MTSDLVANQDDIRFLTVDDVLAIHSVLIDEITPGEPKDVLDRGRLEAAVYAPQQTFDGQYLYSSIYEMAAVYLRGLACGHAFQQGNKRVAFGACFAFLDFNNLDLTITNAQAVAVTLGMVEGRLDVETVADLLREHSTFGPD